MSRAVAVALILLMTVAGACAGFFLKKSTGREKLVQAIGSPFFYLGAALYLICAVLNIYVLRFMPYSVVLPLTSITYVWTLLLARLALREKFTVRKLLGVTAILAGAVLISLFY